MSENIESLEVENPISETASDGPLPQDDVGQQKDARIPTLPEHNANPPDCDLPIKKRKTRRGKSKRKQPYLKYGRKHDKPTKNNLQKPEAPHNDNLFLLEDHGLIELEERLMEEAINEVQGAASTSQAKHRQIGSGESDSEDEFYSTPDDEEQYIMKDFADQYEQIQTEKLQMMSKPELIQEYLSLDKQLSELISKQKKDHQELISSLKKEIDKHKSENENIKEELKLLKSKMKSLSEGFSVSGDSEDSETDSSDSCSSSSSSSSSTCSSRSASPQHEQQIENSSGNSYSPVAVTVETNGHLSPAQSNC